MMTRYKSTYGAFYSLSIIVSDFTSFIPVEDNIKSGQKLYSVKKKETLKTPVGRIYSPFLLSEIYFWILSEQNANNVSDPLMSRPLIVTYAAPWPAGARNAPTTGLRQTKQLVYPEQLLKE